MALPEHVDEKRPITWAEVMAYMSRLSKPVTAYEVQAYLYPWAPGASGARTRLRELEQAGLVEGDKPEGQKHTGYTLTPMGARTLGMPGEDQNALVKRLKAVRKPLEKARSHELAPIKERWDTLIAEVTHAELDLALELLR